MIKKTPISNNCQKQLTPFLQAVQILPEIEKKIFSKKKKNIQYKKKTYQINQATIFIYLFIFLF
jgi:folate-dependent tRNA-U54 methylase TrmFO/GidA